MMGEGKRPRLSFLKHGSLTEPKCLRGAREDGEGEKEGFCSMLLWRGPPPNLGEGTELTPGWAPFESSPHSNYPDAALLPRSSPNTIEAGRLAFYICKRTFTHFFFNLKRFLNPLFPLLLSPWQSPCSSLLPAIYFRSRNGIPWRLSLCDWLVSLSIMPPSFILAVANGRISSFLRLYNIP